MYRPDYYKSLEGYYSVVVRNLKDLNNVFTDLHKGLKRVDDRFFVIKRYDIISCGFILERAKEEEATLIYEFLKENFPDLKPYMLSQPYIEMYLDKVSSPIKGKIYEDGISFFVKERANNSFVFNELKFQWDDLFLIAGAQVEEEEDKKELEHTMNLSYSPKGGLRITSGVAERSVKKKHKDYYLDMIFMYEDGYKHIRVEMLDFKFGFLGLPLKPSRFDNFMNFLQFLVEKSGEDAIIDESAQLLMDGSIYTNLRFRNRRVYTQRLINKFFGKELEKVKIY